MALAHHREISHRDTASRIAAFVVGWENASPILFASVSTLTMVVVFGLWIGIAAAVLLVVREADAALGGYAFEWFKSRHGSVPAGLMVGAALGAGFLGVRLAAHQFLRWDDRRKDRRNQHWNATSRRQLSVKELGPRDPDDSFGRSEE